VHLHQLLQRIKNGQTVNFDQVSKKLPKNIQWQQLFAVEQASKNKHQVDIVDHQAFDLLLHQSKHPGSRQDAANHSLVSSHAVKCDSAYMLCFPAETTGLTQANVKQASRVLSAAAVSQDKLLPMPFTRAHSAILIENQDCFFQWHKMCRLFREQIDLSQSDIYFSAGSRILNPAFSAILDGYQSLHCLFDYDLAGLETATLLSQKTFGETYYLVPDNIAQMHHLFRFPPHSAKDYATMLKLCEHVEQPLLAGAVASTKCFMEQEALLTID
jgi:uncharacterized protein YcfL